MYALSRDAGGITPLLLCSTRQQANAVAGSYTVSATVAGGIGPASFTLTNTALVVGGSGALTGSGTSAAGNANLTAEGTNDWVHWGDGSLTRKAGVTPQISDYSVVGSGGVSFYSNDPRALSWNDGTPTASGTNNNGVYINALQNGFSFTAPADGGTRVLTVHVGGWLSGGTLTAHLSDKSAADFVDSTTPANGQYDRNYTLTYNAASAGQTLTVSWVTTSGGGNVTLNGAALAAAGPSISATAGTPQSATVGAAFGTALQATVKDANNNPLSGVTVTFTAPSTGASASFNGSTSAISTTNANGIAIAPTPIANSQAGVYTVTASASGVSSSAGFSLTNLAGAPASIASTAGNSQSAPVGTTFATALQAIVKDAGNNPLSGVTVTFTAPSTGASASFGGSAAATATTNSSGIATAPTLTANSQTGGYAVTATAAGVGTAANFALNNLAGTPASIAATAGTSQSATVGTVFATALQATVKDAGNNPMSGVTVTFTAPSTGAGATFSGSATATATTNSSGIATAPALTASSLAGVYSVTATVGGVGTPAGFSLTNLAGAPASMVTIAGTPQSTTVSAAFATALQVAVKDAGNNAVTGVTVTFAAPATGAGATFNGSSTATATTNAGGIATAPVLTANGQTGGYAVTASAAGIGTPATFALSNTAVQAVSAMLVQQASGANLGGNQNTLTVTLGNTPRSANVLILFFDQVGASQTITSITGATWTRLAQNYTGNIGDSEIWVGTNPTSSTVTITGTNYFGSFQQGYAIVGEFAGIGTTLDGAALNTTGGSWPVSTASLNTANAGDLLITSTLSYNGGGAGAAVGGPWTLLNAPGGTYSLSAAYQLVTQPGAYSASWNGSGSPQVATIVLALKTSGSGSIGATGGTPQSATVNTAFATALQATVTDSGGHPVSGATVTFTAPGTGASATFGGLATATAVTNALGVATSPGLIANGQAGLYTVSASTSTAGTPASFSLANLAGPPASVAATGGTPQTATVNTVFGTPLQATVKDANNNPLAGVTVTFTAPAGGAGASFAGLASATAVTNASGIATAPALSANGVAGSYTVTATAAGVSASASFNLTNSTAPLVPIKLVQQAQIDSMIDIPSQSLGFASANTAGNWIGVAIFGGQSDTHQFTVTDSNGNTYRRALTVGNTHDNITLGMYYAENINGGPNTVKVVPDNSGYLRVVIVEYSGVATSNSLDVTSAAQGSSISPDSGTVVTTAGGDLLFGASASADAEPFAGPGYNLEELVPAAPGTALTTEDQIQTVAGPASASLTFGSSKDWTMGLAAFKRAP